ncbi:hypothetical protein [Klebsiella phage YC1]|nr:hypothetical protein [Klebsiella phage YC1]WPH68745.1 hypothetical protein [Stenotrophomonas phage BUCTxx100]
MNNSFIEQVKQPVIFGIDGSEKLSVGESLSLKMTEISRGFKEAFRQLKSSAHTIDYGKTAKHLAAVNYFKHTMVPLTGPAYFDPEKTEWSYYVKMVSSTALLLSTALTESGRIYKWLKDVAKTGTVGSSFWFSVTKTDTLANDLQSFMEGIQSSRNTHHRLNQFYDSFKSFYDTVEHFNGAVSGIKSSDIRSLADRIDEVYHLGNIIVDKIKTSQLVFDKDSLKTLQDTINTYNTLINVTGAGLVLLNELTAVFESQTAELGKLK